MTTTIVDRVVAHGENGSILITRDRAGQYCLEARTRKGDRVVITMHPDTMSADDGLLDQLDRFVDRAPAPESFSELLWRFTGARGEWSVKGLAHAIGVSDATVYFWRTGQHRPCERHIRRIAEVLCMTVDDIRSAVERDWRQDTAA